MNNEQYERWKKLPFKKYRVCYTGGVVSSMLVDAPNKTWARMLAGELNSRCKVTRIELEVK